MHAPVAALPHRSPRIISFARMGDEALASRAAAGNTGAFAALCERYHEPLLGYCRSILLDSDDAHDATQSALENALRALPRREPGRPLKPWLYRIAHNEAINIVRRRQPIASGVDTDDLLTVPGPDVDSEQRTRLAQLVDDLRMLPERQRGALVMRELSGLSYDEIGLALGVSNEAARRAVFDARTALHDAVDGRATACTSVRRCLSDGDRRHLRARGVRAHLRSCDDCATFERAMGMRQADLHMLGPWLAGGAGALGLLGYGAGTAGASILAVSATGGGAAAGAGGLGWAGLPVAVKGFAVAAVVATTGTAAVELPKVVKHAAPATQGAIARAPAALSPLHDQVREQALADAANARRARAARAAREAAASARVRTSETSTDAADLAGAGRGARVAPITPLPDTTSPQHSTVNDEPAAARRPATLGPTPEQLAADELQRVRDRILDAFNDAQRLAAPGTQSALAAASGLIESTLGSVGPLLDDILATVGLKLPSNTTTPPASPPSGTTTVTNVLAPVQSLLSGVDGVLQSLFGRR